jgi:hypothetical protein
MTDTSVFGRPLFFGDSSAVLMYPSLNQRILNRKYKISSKESKKI